jgi:hypothetical protein
MGPVVKALLTGLCAAVAAVLLVVLLSNFTDFRISGNHPTVRSRTQRFSDESPENLAAPQENLKTNLTLDELRALIATELKWEIGLARLTPRNK